MFNKIGFNKLLFNRVIPLFKNKEQISLLGEYIGFYNLQVIFKNVLDFLGTRELTVENYLNLYYNENLKGERELYYKIDGKYYKIEDVAKTNSIIELIGEMIYSSEHEEEYKIEEILLKISEVNIDGEN